MSLSEFVVVSCGRVVFEGPLQQCGDYAQAHPEATIFERAKTSAVAAPQIDLATSTELATPPTRRMIGLFTVTIPNEAAFRPKSPETTIPASVTNMPIGDLGRLAISLNAGTWAAAKRVWAAITENGSLVLLPCLPEQRPEDPAAFPVGTRILEKNEAIVEAYNENRARLAVALIPREWTIPIRPLAPFAV